MTEAQLTENDYEAWLNDLASQQVYGKEDRLGTLNFLDATARRRGAESIDLGESISLARSLVPSGSFLGEGAKSVELLLRNHGEGPDGIGAAGDRVTLECHGLDHTHLDALNHFSLHGRFYGDRSFDEAPTVSEVANHGVFTRAVLADITAVRGTDWVDEDQPVTAEDITAGVAGTDFAPGDALLLYMGRDRWEGAGNDFWEIITRGASHPGVGPSGARWLVDNKVAVLGWDFCDAKSDGVPSWSVHRLIWAIGLCLIDNCALAGAAARCEELGRQTGALSASPIATGGTGCVVHPWLIL